MLADHRRYVEFHDRIHAEIERHIPVSVVASIDEFACELMSNENAPARAAEIARSIKEGLCRNVGEYVRCSIGIAPGRYLAKVATDLMKPDGLTILPGELLPGPLLTLKITDLPGIGRNMERQLARKGVFTVEQLWNMDARQLRRLWGSVWGERMWFYLRGIELPESETKRSSVGHSHVLAPELRPAPKARLVARRLCLKAASRLRRMGYEAGAMALSARVENGERWAGEARFPHACDSQSLSRMMEALWQQLRLQARPERIKKVSVTLFDLRSAGQAQEELAFSEEGEWKAQQRRYEKLSRAMDTLNQKFGSDTVLLGMTSKQGRGFTGTKVAFTRIPQLEEFQE